LAATMQLLVELWVTEIEAVLPELEMQRFSSAMDVLRSCLVLVLMDWREQRKMQTRGRMPCAHAGVMDPSGWCSGMAESKY
jgi:hypothetical protein